MLEALGNTLFLFFGNHLQYEHINRIYVAQEAVDNYVKKINDIISRSAATRDILNLSSRSSVTAEHVTYFRVRKCVAMNHKQVLSPKYKLLTKNGVIKQCQLVSDIKQAFWTLSDAALVYPGTYYVPFYRPLAIIAIFHNSFPLWNHWLVFY